MTLHHGSSRVQLCQGQDLGKVGRGGHPVMLEGGLADTAPNRNRNRNRKSSVPLPRLVCLSLTPSFILSFSQLLPQHFPSRRLLDQSERRIRNPSRQGPRGSRDRRGQRRGPKRHRANRRNAATTRRGEDKIS